MAKLRWRSNSQAVFSGPRMSSGASTPPFFLDRLQASDSAEALGFAFEARPRIALGLTGGRLPLGCHAWSRMDRRFWLEQIGSAEDLSEPEKAEALEREQALS